MQHTHFPYFLGSVAESVEVFQVGALGSYPLQGQKLRGTAGEASGFTYPIDLEVPWPQCAAWAKIPKSHWLSGIL